MPQAKSKSITLPPLKKGEHYAGIILDKTGKPSAHLILLPGGAQDINWNDAMAWAKKAGGDLPTRQEQALLFANTKHHFEPRYYWSNETHADVSACAWGQSFTYGYQYGWLKGSKSRARAVRRVPIR